MASIATPFGGGGPINPAVWAAGGMGRAQGMPPPEHFHDADSPCNTCGGKERPNKSAQLFNPANVREYDWLWVGFGSMGWVIYMSIFC